MANVMSDQSVRLAITEARAAGDPSMCVFCNETAVLEHGWGAAEIDFGSRLGLVKRGRWHVGGAYAVAATLQELRCNRCGAPSYLIALALIDNPNPPDNWVDAELENSEDQPALYIVEQEGLDRPVPKSWVVSRFETSDWQVDAHCFGPFPTQPGLFGPGGHLGPTGEQLIEPAAAVLIAGVLPALLVLHRSPLGDAEPYDLGRP